MEEKQIGTISDYFAHVGVIAVKLSAPLKVGDTIRVKGGTTDFTQKIESMQINNKAMQNAKAGDEVGIKINEKARKDYKVFIIV
jgi:putative protease